MICDHLFLFFACVFGCSLPNFRSSPTYVLIALCWNYPHKQMQQWMKKRLKWSFEILTYLYFAFFLSSIYLFFTTRVSSTCSAMRAETQASAPDQSLHSRWLCLKQALLVKFPMVVPPGCNTLNHMRITTNHGNRSRTGNSNIYQTHFSMQGNFVFTTIRINTSRRTYLPVDHSPVWELLFVRLVRVIALK